MMAQGKLDYLQQVTFLREIMKYGRFKNVDSSVYQVTMLNIVLSLH